MKKTLLVSVALFALLGIFASSAWAAVSVTVNSSGRLIFSGDSGASNLSLQNQAGDYNWLFSGAGSIGVSGDSCRKDGADAECKGVKKGPIINLLGGNDRLTIKSTALAAFADGGAGVDYIRAGSKGDDISGGKGDDLLLASGGANKITGGTGEDIIITSGGGKDVVRCGVKDMVFADSKDDLIGCRHQLRIEKASCLGYDEWVYQNNADHTAIMSTTVDLAFGGDGSENLRAQGGNDCMFGQGGDDRLNGEDGEDIVFGGEGNDVLFGGANDDKLHGSPGNDKIYGGANTDLILARDGEVDLVSCGQGKDDVARLDWNDRLLDKGCEKVKRSPRPSGSAQ